jgi:acyl carrier protein
MDEGEIRDWLRTTLIESRGETGAAADVDVTDENAIDSLEGVELVIAAEVQYGIRIPDSGLSRETCRSIERLAALVASRINAKARRTA